MVEDERSHRAGPRNAGAPASAALEPVLPPSVSIVLPAGAPAFLAAACWNATMRA